MADPARILTIDDDAVVRRLLVVALSDRGHVVLEAADGETGLQLARDEHPDLVLLDMGLPDLHGSAVLDAIKGDAATAAIPVIMVSAWAEANTAEVARAHGAHDVLRKPFDIGEMIGLVERTLGVPANERPTA